MSSDHDRFACCLQSFLESLRGGVDTVEDAFGSLLEMENLDARIAAADKEKNVAPFREETGAGSLNLEGDARHPYFEILEDCRKKLGSMIMEHLESLANNRKKIRESDHVTFDSKQAMLSSKSAVVADHARRSNRPRGSQRAKLTPQQLRERIRKQDEKYREKEQNKAAELRERQEKAFEEQQEREAADIPLLGLVTRLCRILESLHILGLNNNGEALTRTKFLAKSDDSNKMSGISIFSEILCACLNERFGFVIDELRSHRSLKDGAKDTNFMVSASDESPYLKAVSSILKYADYFIEQLVYGDYLIESKINSAESPNSNETTRIMQRIATSEIVLEVEKLASQHIVLAIDWFCTDTQLDLYVEKADQYLESHQKNYANVKADSCLITEADIVIIDEILNDVMYAMAYCGSFTSFVFGLGIVDNAVISGSDTIYGKQLELSSTYIRLEECWMTYSLRKAETLATVSGEGSECAVSIVDDMWFILHEKAFARCVASRNGLTCSAIANHIFRLLDDNYSDYILGLLNSQSKFPFFSTSAPLAAFDDSEALDASAINQRGLSKPRSTVDSNEDFSALLDNEVQGVRNLSSHLLISINTVERSAARLQALSRNIESQFRREHPDKLFQVEMALNGLETAGKKHDTVRSKAIEEIVDGCFAPSICAYIKIFMANTSYNMDHSAFRKYEQSDLFAIPLVENQLSNRKSFQKCCNTLSKENFVLFLLNIARVVANSWEKELMSEQVYFNDLGGLQFAQDVRSLTACMKNLYYFNEEKQETEHLKMTNGNKLDTVGINSTPEHLGSEAERPDFLDFQKQLRKHFARLSQIAFLLELDQSSQVEIISYALEPVLSEEDVRNVLRKRLADDPSGADLLNVSMHVAKPDS